MNSTMKGVLGVVGGIAVIGVSAQVSVPVPGTPVPQSLQTLAVLVVGGLLGVRLGALSTFLYALLGGAGLPIFADGASGMEHLRGPTAGYIAGFIIAATWMGGAVQAWRAKHDDEGLAPSAFAAVTGAAVVGHAIILGVGWYGLGRIVGWSDAFSGGVEPFIVGGLVKSIAVAAVVVPLLAWSAARSAPGPSGRSARE